jgi:predicted ABC-type ATPase
MSEKHTSRMRVFAGPNGSGKSTTIKEVQRNFYTGVYINADDIEKTGREKGFINLGDYGLTADETTFTNFLQQSTLFQKAAKEGFLIDLTFSDNVIKIRKDTHSYEAALIAEFLRQLLIEEGNTFSFETVMSHPSKLDIFKNAHAAGFKNYLYFIATVSPKINIDRVAARVKKGGHAVDPRKIEERYYRSLDLLSDMIPYCHRCYLIDNSLEGKYRLIAEIEDNEAIIIHNDDIPDWVYTYAIQKMGFDQ